MRRPLQHVLFTLSLVSVLAGCGGRAFGLGGPGDPNDDPPLTPGEPTFPHDGYCSEAAETWAFCEDFDSLGVGGPATYPAPGQKLKYSSHSHITVREVTCETSLDCDPYLLNGSAFTNAEDSGFGMAVTRIEQPFDFADRTGHIHFTGVLKGHPRMVMAVHISPRATNSMPDTRDAVNGAMDHAPGMTLFYGGEGGWPFGLMLWKDGQSAGLLHADGPLGIDLSGLHEFDVFVTRTRIRLLLDGVERFDTTFEDIGFDKGYVHLSQIAYNPVKDGYSGKEANTFQWDNIAFDGPAYAANALTPADQQDVLFRAFSTTSCTVRGLPAEGLPREMWGTWHTWHIRLPREASLPTADEISCPEIPGSPYIPQPHVQDIESITQ